MEAQNVKQENPEEHAKRICPRSPENRFHLRRRDALKYPLGRKVDTGSRSRPGWCTGSRCPDVETSYTIAPDLFWRPRYGPRPHHLPSLLRVCCAAVFLLVPKAIPKFPRLWGFRDQLPWWVVSLDAAGRKGGVPRLHVPELVKAHMLKVKTASFWWSDLCRREVRGVFLTSFKSRKRLCRTESPGAGRR